MDNYKDLIALGEAKRIHQSNKEAGKPRSEKPKRSNEWFIIGTLAVFLFFYLVSGNSETVDANALLNEAKEKRVAAMQAKCSDWRDRWLACYGENGSEAGCNQLPESTAWFTNEFGAIPETACSAATVNYDFLAVASK